MIKSTLSYAAKKSLPGLFMGLAICILRGIGDIYTGAVLLDASFILRFLLPWALFGYAMTFAHYFTLEMLKHQFPTLYNHLFICFFISFFIGYFIAVCFISLGFAYTKEIHPLSMFIGLGSMVFTHFFIHFEKKDAQIALQTKQQDLALLNERSRIARDLHDSMSQNLFAMDLHLNTLKIYHGKDDVRLNQMTDQIIEMVKGVQSKMRLMIYELRPANLKGSGLADAIENLLVVYRKKHRSSIQLIFNGNEDLLNENIQLLVFRIVQETLAALLSYSGENSMIIAVTIEEKKVYIKISLQGDFSSARNSDLCNIKARYKCHGGNINIISNKEEAILEAFFKVR
ncbi:MAG: histidine kinase [Clostridia bacterium]|nr:histidine kinase [Clostridia bacterium]